MVLHALQNHVLHKHINVVHANEIISDADLNVVAPVMRHLLRNYFQCEFCDYRGGNRNDLNNHTLTIHSDVRKLNVTARAVIICQSFQEPRADS